MKTKTNLLGAKRPKENFRVQPLARSAKKKMNPGAKCPQKTFVHPQSYHVVSYRIVSHGLSSYRIASHYIVSYRIVSHRTVSHRIGVYRIVPCCIVSTVSYRIVSLCARAFACWCTRVRLRLFAHALARSPAFARAFARSLPFFCIVPRDLASSFPGT